ncbi:MAG: hypothetical protein ACFCUG_02145 [Thiotrichales bacterium]
MHPTPSRFASLRWPSPWSIILIGLCASGAYAGAPESGVTPPPSRQAVSSTPANDYTRIEAENRKREAENAALRQRMQELEAAVKEKDAVSSQKTKEIETLNQRARLGTQKKSD